MLTGWNLRIELGDGVGLCTEEVVQSIGGVRVYKAIANPFCSFDAKQARLSRRAQIGEGGIRTFQKSLR